VRSIAQEDRHIEGTGERVGKVALLTLVWMG